MSDHETDLATAMDTKSATGLEAVLRSIIREELASLGGHLLATYHADAAGEQMYDTLGRPIEPPTLATLGGYLLEHYGDGTDTAAE
jgi:hypothetical protein